MGDAIKHCLANLTNFQGRDSRGTFWWWILAVVIVNFGFSMISGLIFTVSSMSGAMQSIGAGGDQEQIQAEMMQAMAGSLGIQTWIGVAISILGLLLIIATFVRRLNDANLPGFIAVIPILTTLAGAYFSVSFVGEMSEVMASGDLEAINALSSTSGLWGSLSWVGYLVVIVCGLIPGKDGPAD
ncbi:MAG: DUF805 domain-containing protein [Pseudomonadota bacterium]